MCVRWSRPCVRPSVRPVKNESKNIHENRSFEWRDILFGFPKCPLRNSPKLGSKKYVSPLKGTILVAKNDRKWLKLRPQNYVSPLTGTWSKKPVVPSGPLCSAGVIGFFWEIQELMNGRIISSTISSQNEPSSHLSMRDSSTALIPTATRFGMSSEMRNMKSNIRFQGFGLTDRGKPWEYLVLGVLPRRYPPLLELWSIRPERRESQVRLVFWGCVSKFLKLVWLGSRPGFSKWRATSASWPPVLLGLLLSRIFSASLPFLISLTRSLKPERHSKNHLFGAENLCLYPFQNYGCVYCSSFKFVPAMHRPRRASSTRNTSV